MEAASIMVIRVIMASVVAFWIAVTFCAETYDPTTGKKWPLSNRLIRYFAVVAGLVAEILWNRFSMR